MNYRYSNLSDLKDITNSDDVILELIAKEWIKTLDNMIRIIAEEKYCDEEEITEQDCIEYLRANHKIVQYFFRNRRFCVNSIEDLENLQEKGVLDRLPLDCEYVILYRTHNIKQEQIEKFRGRKIVFPNRGLGFSCDAFNTIISNGFEFEPAPYQANALNEINIQNIDETIRNVSKYKNVKFNFNFDINLNDAKDLETIEYAMNSVCEASNVNMLIDINVNNTDLSNIFEVFKNGEKSWKNIKAIQFHISNEGVQLIEELAKNINLLNTEDVSKISLTINLDEEYIKSLDEKTIEKIDADLANLINNNISVSIRPNDKDLNNHGADRTRNHFDDIHSCFKFYNKVQEIIGTIPKEASDIDKVTYISNWIMQNLSYDYDSYEKERLHNETYGELPPMRVGNEELYQKYFASRIPKRSLLQLLDGQIGVCANIAELTAYLLSKVGIECKYIRSNHRHAFNIVYIEGMPYWLDNTWDVNLYDYDRNKEYELSKSSYFLTSSIDFYKTHSKFDDALEGFECPETVDREKIRKSLQRTSEWKHIIDQSVNGNGLYSKTRPGLLSRIGEKFKSFINNRRNENEGEKIDG